MDVITNAINSIIYEIPEEILEDAFKGNDNDTGDDCRVLNRPFVNKSLRNVLNQIWRT